MSSNVAPIKTPTPRATAMDVDSVHQHGAMDVEGAQSHASHGSHGSASVHSHHHGAVATTIPAVSYAMPGPPTWRVKQQFATWEIDHNRFEIKRQLGKGSYGTVVEAVDHLLNIRVAIKRIPDVFDVFENAKRIYREVHILRQMNHPNVVRLVHIQQPADLLAFKELYVVFELMDTDLAKLTKDETQCLTIPHVRWFLYQLLLGMKYIHSARVLHRDIKPANILLTEACDLKICDFGLARSYDLEEGGNVRLEGDAVSGTGSIVPADMDEDRDIIGVSQPRDGSTTDTSAGSGSASGSASGPEHHLARQMTRHVVTRWYRAPELPLYNDGHYSPAIDVWSVGCVYAEMLGMLDTGNPDDRYDRRALFPGGACAPMSKDRAAKAGKDGKPRKEQLDVIFEVLGTPTEDEVRRVKTEEAREALHRLPARKPDDLQKRFPAADADSLDLLRRFFRFLPEDRITIDQALAHRFLAPVRRPHDEVGRPEGAIQFGAITPDNIRRLMVEEVRFFNRTIPANWEAIALQQYYAMQAAALGQQESPTYSPA